MTKKKSILIRNARLWPSAEAPVLEDASLLIRDGRIESAGRVRARAEVVIDADGCLLMPGFIQTHVHLCQTLFRGLAEDLPLLPWLRRRIWPLEAAHDEASIAASARLACVELIRGGTTAFLSMETVRHTEAVLRAVSESGLMGFVGHCLMDASGGYAPLAVPIDDALAECDRLNDSLRGHERVRLAVAPRFVLSCTGESLREAADFARDRGMLLHTHSSEQLPEIEEVRRRTGRGNIEYLHRCGLTGPDCYLAHGVHLSPEEIRLLAATRTRILHCPGSNAKLGSGIAPVPEMLAAGVPVSLASDGAACNNRLDMFAEMRLAGQLQKLRLGPQALPARDIVRMATLGGAEALGAERSMGTLEPGKRANLILVDLKRCGAPPGGDVASDVVYSASAADVAMTIVDGRILFEDGRVTTLEEERCLKEAARQRRLLLGRARLGR